MWLTLSMNTSKATTLNYFKPFGIIGIDWTEERLNVIKEKLEYIYEEKKCTQTQMHKTKCTNSKSKV